MRTVSPDFFILDSTCGDRTQLCATCTSNSGIASYAATLLVFHSIIHISVENSETFN